jgi:hypothetical protein
VNKSDANGHAASPWDKFWSDVFGSATKKQVGKGASDYAKDKANSLRNGAVEFVKFVTPAGSAIASYESHKKGKNKEALGYGTLAALESIPFVKALKGVKLLGPAAKAEAPVVFFSKPGASAAEVQQFVDYCAGCNKALAEGQLSATGRVSTKGTLRDQADAINAQERAAAAKAGRPYQGVAGHGPDTTWTGRAQSAQPFMDMSKAVNNSLGRQAQNYPIGYQPTVFRYGGPR